MLAFGLLLELTYRVSRGNSFNISHLCCSLFSKALGLPSCCSSLGLVFSIIWCTSTNGVSVLPSMQPATALKANFWFCCAREGSFVWEGVLFWSTGFTRPLHTRQSGRRASRLLAQVMPFNHRTLPHLFQKVALSSSSHCQLVRKEEAVTSLRKKKKKATFTAVAIWIVFSIWCCKQSKRHAIHWETSVMSQRSGARL